MGGTSVLYQLYQCFGLNLEKIKNTKINSDLLTKKGGTGGTAGTRHLSTCYLTLFTCTSTAVQLVQIAWFCDKSLVLTKNSQF